ncbi:MAG: hypothetical protein ACLGG0_05045 [Bacteriovoracia bacterium]
MLKKLLIVLPLGFLVLLGMSFFQRIEKNPHGVIPAPYKFAELGEKIQVDAPLLIAGDRMAQRFGLFKETLSLEISQGLSKALKVGVLAKENQGMHRTLNQMENLAQWPKVVIYTGGSEEMVEDKFLIQQIPIIRTNFERYQDDRWRTLMMLMPESARLIYEPLERIILADSPKIADEKGEEEFQRGLEISLRLYEIELLRFIEEARSHDTLLILMTVPVNLDIAPKKTCEITRTPEAVSEMEAIRTLLKQQDYKAAYPRSKTLMETSLANAEVHYLFGQIAHRVGQHEESKIALKKAAAYDCKSWRANEMTNNIIRKVADSERVTLFDFSALVEEDWNRNTTFFDEIYPQDLYYERANKALAVVLKRLLKI